jgi:hypothetical protein
MRLKNERTTQIQMVSTGFPRTYTNSEEEHWLTCLKSEPDASQAEISTSWALFILIMLLILALFASYILQTRKIQAVHETVMSIFAGTTYHGTV